MLLFLLGEGVRSIRRRLQRCLGGPIRRDSVHWLQPYPTNLMSQAARTEKTKTKHVFQSLPICPSPSEKVLGMRKNRHLHSNKYDLLGPPRPAEARATPQHLHRSDPLATGSQRHGAFQYLCHMVWISSMSVCSYDLEVSKHTKTWKVCRPGSLFNTARL